MRTSEIREGQSFWHNGERFTATSNAWLRGDSWVVVWTVNEDGVGETLVLAHSGNVLEA